MDKQPTGETIMAEKKKVHPMEYGQLSSLITELNPFPGGKVQVLNNKEFLLSYDDKCWNPISIQQIRKRFGSISADAQEGWRILTLMDQELMDEEE